MLDTSKRSAIFSSPLFVSECREYAHNQGLDVVLEVIDIAGGTTQADSIQTLVHAAKAGSFEIIIIPLLQQLGNIDEEIATLLLTLEGLGVSIVTSTQHSFQGTATATFTDLVETIGSKVAEIEKERLKDRRLAGRKHKSN